MWHEARRHYAGKKGVYLWVTKGRKRKLILIPDDASDILLQYMESNGSKTGTCIFRNIWGNPLTPRTLQKGIDRIRQEACIAGYTLYDMRNTSAAVMFAYGAESDGIAQQMRIGKLEVWRYFNAVICGNLQKETWRYKSMDVRPPLDPPPVCRNATEMPRIRIPSWTS